MTKTLVLATAAALAAVVAPQRAPTTADRLTLAVVRPDGILVPFAAIEDGTWMNPWPEPDDERLTARLLGSGPDYWRQRQEAPPATWHIWEPDTRAPATARVLTDVLFEAHCQLQLGLLTDIVRSGDNSHGVALALDRILPVHLPIDLREDTQQASEWKDLIATALSAFAGYEKSALADWQSQGTGRASVADLPAQTGHAIALGALYAHRSGATRTMYFQGTRDVGRPIEDRENACNGMSSVTGWIRATDGQPPEVLDASGVITDCDGMDTTGLRPLGIVEWRGEPLWLAVEHGWESEAYSVISIASTVRRLLTTHGGGC